MKSVRRKQCQEMFDAHRRQRVAAAFNVDRRISTVEVAPDGYNSEWWCASTSCIAVDQLVDRHELRRHWNRHQRRHRHASAYAVRTQVDPHVQVPVQLRMFQLMMLAATSPAAEGDFFPRQIVFCRKSALLRCSKVSRLEIIHRKRSRAGKEANTGRQ